MNRSVLNRIPLEEREVLNRHRAFVLWLTGLPASGKSTLAYALEQALLKQNLRSYVLDGDDLRYGLSSDLGFSPQDRSENIRRAGHVAKLMVDAGLIVITSFISPYRKDRERVKALFSPDRFYEVYLDCSLEVCERRDPKGNYQKARQGRLKEFTGISAPYEPPLSPALVIPTGEMNVEESLARLLQFILNRLEIKP
ncbi:MAG TPA: adenylyl-sulfate kinase [Terriglobia bacterium]|nr:adenylyl-sulfate kinase [Terriglobia bacterium]